jgi:hypothetical protein
MSTKEKDVFIFDEFRKDVNIFAKFANWISSNFSLSFNLSTVCLNNLFCATLHKTDNWISRLLLHIKATTTLLNAKKEPISKFVDNLCVWNRDFNIENVLWVCWLGARVNNALTLLTDVKKQPLFAALSEVLYNHLQVEEIKELLKVGANIRYTQTWDIGSRR